MSTEPAIPLQELDKKETSTLPNTETPYNAQLLSPENKANFLSILTYSWLTPIFKLGSKRPLEQQDLWQLSDKWKSEILCTEFEGHWKEELKRLEELKKQDTSQQGATESKKKKKNEATGKSMQRVVWTMMFR